MKFEYENSNLPRKTLDLLHEIAVSVSETIYGKYPIDALALIKRESRLIGAKSNRQRAAAHATIEECRLSVINDKIAAYNEICAAWKGSARNRPMRLFAGSGSSHFWISLEETKARVAIIYLE